MPGWRLGGLTTPIVGPEPEYWFEADYAVVVDPILGVTDMDDRTSHARNVGASLVGFPVFVPSGINGLPSFRTSESRMVYTGANVFAQGDPRSVINVCRPLAEFGNVGGYLTSFRRSDRDFALGLYNPTAPPTQQFVYTNCVDAGNNIRITPSIDFAGQDLLLVHEFDGVNLTTTINGVVMTVDQSVTGDEDGVDTGFSIFGIPCSNPAGWRGLWSAQICFNTPTAPDTFKAYCSTKYGVG